MTCGDCLKSVGIPDVCMASHVCLCDWKKLCVTQSDLFRLIEKRRIMDKDVILLDDMAVNWRMAAIQYANSARDLSASVDCGFVV
jgi:hypothetical protein